MFDYLQKFNSLPKDLRDKASTPAVMTAIEDLEKKYEVALAAVIMKVMIKDIAVGDLAGYFLSEFRLDKTSSQQLTRELKNRVFAKIADYLEIKNEAESKKELETEVGQKITASGIRPEPPRTSSNFFFSPEDEEEVKELAQRITKFKGLGLSESKIDDRLDKIISATQINFGSELLVRRFKQIVGTYLRGIRDRIETKQTLMKSFGEGGLDFDEESVSKVLAISEKSIKDSAEIFTSPPIKIKLPKEDLANLEPDSKKIADAAEQTDGGLAGLKSIGVRDADYDLSILKKGKRKDQDIKKLDVKHELAPPPPAVKKFGPFPVMPKEKLTSGLSEQKIDKVVSEEKKIDPKATPAKPKIQVRSPGEIGYKKKIEDVKYVPRIMNPIDELRHMSLANFRRLAPSPNEIAEKIKEKINLLEEEQYSKRIEGTKAWRRSPINRLYLQIGQQSISQGKPVDAIIEERKKASQDYLSNDEFKAIMDLNKSLRF